MCGILGKITISGAHESPATFDAALSQIGHRGPDDRGVFHMVTQENIQISLGHTRLSILDISVAGHQPMVSQRTGAVIVYNGEVYNFKEIRHQIEQRGLSFTSNCDTEVIIAAYDEYQEEFVHQLNGMFAIGILDVKRKKIILVRDRLGIKPLYYYWDGKQLAFGSEITAFAALPSLTLEVDHDAIQQYLMYGYIPGPLSIFQNVRKLPAGCILQFDLNHPAVKERRYWNVLEYYAQPAPFNSEAEVLEALREELTRSVRRRLISDVPLGAFLSGGIDSSLIVSLMRSVHTGPVKTFTIGFAEKQWDEAPLAKKIAQHLGTVHNEFYFSEENTLEIARTAAAYSDEPFADPASIPTLALSRFTRQQVTVALSGDGGDELFWGYSYYKTNPLIYIMYEVMPFGIRRFMSAGLKLLPGDRCLSLSYLLGLQDRLAFQLSPGIWNPNLYYPKLHRHATQLNRRLEIGRDVAAKIKELDWDTKTGAIDIHCSLVDQMLTKIDRASMSTALEVRVPLLDFNVVQLAARIPSRFKTAGGELKHLPRALLGEFIPQSLWDRPKKGFSVPLNIWFRTVLKEWAYDELGSRDHHLCEWLDPTEIQTLFNDHVSGRRNAGRLIWACLQLAGWDRMITSVRKKTFSGHA